MALKDNCTSAFNWFCRNRKTGEITIAQKPNLILGLTVSAFLIRYLLELLDAPSNALTLAQWASVILLLLFGMDELFRGVNPWRRTIGISVCVLALMSVFNIAT